MAYETTQRVRDRLRAERKRRGWDTLRMARALRDAAEDPREMPTLPSLKRSIERWEGGQVTRISERYRLLYCKALNMSEDELFNPDTLPPPDAPLPRPTPGDIPVVRNMLTALTASDRQFGGEHARQYATDYLTRVVQPRLHAPAPEPLRRDLFAVAAEFSMRVSAMHMDVGQTTTALQLLATAASMAHESDDTALSAWVLARRGEHELHLAATGTRPDRRRTHIDQALAYTGGACGLARNTGPLSRAFVRTKHALAWSMTGDPTETQRALAAMWRAYEQPATGPEPAWAGSYGWGHLRHEEARCLVNIGLGDRAVRAAEESLTVRQDARPKAFTLGVLAIGHAQAGRIDQACGTARELITLAGQLSSARVRLRLREVLDALEPHRTVPAVGEVFEAARPVLHPTG
ncbi:hypothetical protein [Thermomonospora cellulosilytica]|uniref:Transcriptional regulator with XRE-family HTH domain n=1 Tax=Thermomonospora cellulosilytica TaxID=1411118 RepID=A0A7W3R7M2_9ACTN|nr:hypothetical protein [Thermomonospora cellulosilytica]MBA9002822.1 transcriptional regulator with XRE-family HTH domain [Thermomonospora cellulosilytica]